MKINVLDHGYVHFVEAWGHGYGGEAVNDCEVGIIEAARQSTNGGFVSWEAYKNHPKGDLGLLSYLHKNKHGTPFEFSGMTIEVQAPIFVFREWHRHRTQSYNEMSARYAPLPDLYYEPDIDNVVSRIQFGLRSANRQAGSLPGTNDLSSRDIEELAHHWLGPRHLLQVYRLAEDVYQAALAAGIPKELARLVMPVGHYSRMRASANLRNWLMFLTLRTDPAAQWEIRQYAAAVLEVVAAKFPQVYKLFTDQYHEKSSI